MGQSPWEIEFYVTERGDCPVDEFLDALQKVPRAKVERWIVQLGQQGPHLPRPYADVLDGPIRELRIQFGNAQYRILYFFHDRIVLLTHGIIKKSWAVPPGEIERARRYMNDWLSRKG